VSHQIISLLVPTISIKILANRFVKHQNKKQEQIIGTNMPANGLALNQLNPVMPIPGFKKNAPMNAIQAKNQMVVGLFQLTYADISA
jgi:hypothetical protein